MNDLATKIEIAGMCFSFRTMDTAMRIRGRSHELFFENLVKTHGDPWGVEARRHYAEVALILLEPDGAGLTVEWLHENISPENCQLLANEWARQALNLAVQSGLAGRG